MRAPKKSWIVLVLLLAVFTLPPLSASAQQLNQEDYKLGLDKATAVYKSGDLVGALLGYLEVRGKFSGPEVDYSIARMYQKLHQCPDALVFYMFVMNGYDLPDDDPLFTGQDLIYRRTNDGFTLYTTGPDGVDDGGLHDPHMTEDHDVVYWPPPN